MSSRILPSSSVAVLQSWYQSHRNSPYPNNKTKQKLAAESSLTVTQVTNWLSNARKRQKPTDKDNLSNYRQLSPIETWLSSSSDDEPASEADIKSAAEKLTSSPHIHQPPAITSYASSEASSGSAFSQCEDATLSGPRRKGRKRTFTEQGVALSSIKYYPVSKYPFLADIPRSPSDKEPEKRGNEGSIENDLFSKKCQFQCTFCLRRLSSKTWKRHEESQHLPQHHWICMRNGPTLRNSDTASDFCAFCLHENPDSEHFEIAHKINRCMARTEDKRTFARKDHLVQHLQQMHESKLHSITATAWTTRISYNNHNWTCGFCGETLRNWDERASHISAHFREGCTMSSWDSNRVKDMSASNIFTTMPRPDALTFTPLDQAKWLKQQRERTACLYACGAEGCGHRFPTVWQFDQHLRRRHGHELSSNYSDDEIRRRWHESSNSFDTTFNRPKEKDLQISHTEALPSPPTTDLIKDVDPKPVSLLERIPTSGADILGISQPFHSPNQYTLDHGTPNPFDFRYSEGDLCSSGLNTTDNVWSCRPLAGIAVASAESSEFPASDEAGFDMWLGTDSWLHEY